MMNTKIRRLILIGFCFIAACSEQKVDESSLVTPTARIEKTVKQQQTLHDKVELRIELQPFLQLYVRNLSEQSLMAIQIQSTDGAQSLRHVFANGYLLPGTSRIISRKDIANEHNKDWKITNLAFDISKKA
jgi:hypothetical protein